MASLIPLLLLRLVATGVLFGVAGWHTSGILPSSPTYHRYVGKFCFDYAEGQAQVGYFDFIVQGKVVEPKPPVLGPIGEGKMYLMVFDDAVNHWEVVRADWGAMTCEEMLRFASFQYLLSPLDGKLNRTVKISETDQPRFWHFTFSACGVAASDSVTYEIRAENILQGNLSEFGVDQKRNLGLQIVASFLFIALSYILRLTTIGDTGAEALRSRALTRLLLGSAICSAGGASCLALHYAVYMINGEGLISIEVVGQSLVCTAKASLAALMLLTAKGWALFYAPDNLLQRQFVMCTFGCVIVISLVCEIHADFFQDWSTSLYLYESGPGITILLLNLLLYLEAWRSMRETYIHETSEEVQIFYTLVFVAASLYFLTPPCSCLVAMLLDPWVRSFSVCMPEVVSRFAATSVLVACLRPSRLDAMVNARLDHQATVGELASEEETEDDERGYFLRAGRKGTGESSYDRSELVPAE